jgi:hypothetical protein
MKEYVEENIYVTKCHICGKESQFNAYDAAICQEVHCTGCFNGIEVNKPVLAHFIRRIERYV